VQTANIPVRNILIVGDGIAAWLSAVMLARATGRGKVLIGVAGARGGADAIENEFAGSTLPSFGPRHATLGFVEGELMRATQATYKLGDEFRDWDTPGGTYVHAFADVGARLDAIAFHHLLGRLRAEGERIDIGDYSVAAQAARLGRFAHPSQDGKSAASTFSYALHLDAPAYARYLRAYAEHLGVTPLNGRLASVQRRESDGFIEAVLLEDGRRLAAQLYLDCSGAAGDLIQGVLEAGFESWAQWLPCNRALSAFTARQAPPRPVTEFIARSAGCQLRIPLQQGNSNGFIYSAAHLADDEAQASFRAGLDAPVTREPHAFRFEQGRRRQFWSHNCVAIGASAAVLEPLGSAGLHLMMSALTHLLTLFPDVSCAASLATEYNRVMAGEYRGVRDLLVLHYHATRRADSEFWRHCRAMQLPDSLAHRLELFRHRGHFTLDDADTFMEPDWMQVFLGQGIWPERTDPLADFLDLDMLRQKVERMRQIVHRTAEGLPPHESYLAQRLAPRPAPR